MIHLPGFEWWLTAIGGVAGGLALNIVSTAIFPQVERVYLRAGESWKAYRVRRAATRLGTATYLSQRPFAPLAYGLREVAGGLLWGFAAIWLGQGEITRSGQIVYWSLCIKSALNFVEAIQWFSITADPTGHRDAMRRHFDALTKDIPDSAHTGLPGMGEADS